MKFNVISYALNKYGSMFPGLVTEDGMISLTALGDMIQIYNRLEKDNDLNAIKALGLEDLKEDLKIITQDKNAIRILKLKRILK